MKWQTYEETATYLLDYFAERFGLERVEEKQAVHGHRSGTNWVIDAKGVCLNGEGFMIVECRRYMTSRQNQEKVGALAFRIIDTGAQGGILVSPLGLQSGAAMIAESENILHVELDAESTSSDFAMKFLGQMMVGASIALHAKVGMTVSDEVMRTCTTCGQRFVVEDNEQKCRMCGK